MNAKEIIENIDAIYAAYAIPNNLQRHMFRVAAVAEVLCRNCKEEVPSKIIIATALIHDLGNFVKMKFIPDTEALFDENEISKIPFFKEKQKEFTQKYGSDHFLANITIAKELKAPKAVIDLLSNPFLDSCNTKEFTNLPLLIFVYSDFRVSPTAITTLEERLEEYSLRYQMKHDPAQKKHSEKFTIFAKQLEQELFKHIKLEPKDITTEVCEKYIAKYLK